MGECRVDHVRSYEVLHADERTLMPRYVVPEPEPYRAARDPETCRERRLSSKTAGYTARQ